ncbi:hypothetical protein FRC04_011634 [Tulasnella sp. 424]|nr:hypothetical protein FRC04_011634 [Tulasnella sp. 424]KAG8971452.1 hypothetical protein FRC05_011025 [Tulasnella sp. 425]
MAPKHLAPSVQWEGVESALEDCDPDYAKRIQDTLANLPLNQFEQHISRLRTPRVPCTINRQRYVWGHYHLVLEVAFEDSVYWILRVRMPPLNELPSWLPEADPAEAVRSVKSEIATLRFLRERTTLPVPEVFDFALSTDNQFGVIYMVMSVAPGKPVFDQGIDLLVIDEPEHQLHIPKAQVLLKDAADMQLQLSQLRFDKIGSIYFDPEDSSKYVIGRISDSGLGPFSTAMEYYTAEANLFRLRVINRTKPQTRMRQQMLWVAWLYRSALLAAVDPRDNNGPFPLCHGDLHNENVHINEEGHQVSVVDWDSAFAAPVESFAVPGLFLCYAEPLQRKHLNKAAHGMFLQALVDQEAEGKAVEPAFPSGRSLSQLYSTFSSHLINYFAFIRADYRWAGPGLYRALFGDDADVDVGFERFRKSKFGREWLAASGDEEEVDLKGGMGETTDEGGEESEDSE